MRVHTVIRSWSAIGVGVFFTLVTCFVLLEDVVRHGAAITTKHVMTLAVLAGTIYFGHRFWIEARSLRLGTMLGCVVLFLAGTATCVLMSAGRNAEVTVTRAQEAVGANSERSRSLLDRDEARARYLAAVKAETDECASGQGEKCRAKRITTQLRREDFDAADSKLRAQRPEQVANADVKAAAQLLSHLPYVTADARAIEALLLLFYPFLQALFCEIGAIVGYAIGLGHTVRQALPGTGGNLAAIGFRFPRSATVSNPERVAERVSDEQAVLDALAGAARPVTNSELAVLMGVSEGEASKRVSALNGRVHRVRSGREVSISLRPVH